MTEKEKTARLVLYAGWGFAIASFGYLFMVTFLTLPTSGVEHAKTIVGFLLGVGISTILQYYWGSSSGSAEKSETIAEELSGPKPPVEEVKP
jgi:predicted CDP-diglyceride synthetase/phosphatidate cytidylyltransferase